MDAVRSSLEIQGGTIREAARQPEARRMLFRIGINVGDVIVEEHDIYGHHVNLAARLGQLARPGDTLVSGFVREYVRGRVECGFDDLGEHGLKNIEGAIKVWRISTEGQAPGHEATRAMRLSLLGPFKAVFGGRELAFRSRKARALIGYLATQDVPAATRERVVGLLWSESPEAQARAVLRQVVRDLRERAADAGFRRLPDRRGRHRLRIRRG